MYMHLKRTYWTTGKIPHPVFSLPQMKHQGAEVCEWREKANRGWLHHDISQLNETQVPGTGEMTIENENHWSPTSLAL
jgi:hypothetical protein